MPSKNIFQEHLYVIWQNTMRVRRGVGRGGGVGCVGRDNELEMSVMAPTPIREVIFLIFKWHDFQENMFSKTF